MDQQIRADIELLLDRARQKIEAADKAGDPRLFNEASLKYGHVAHRVYLALDKPERSCECYHNKDTRRVMLDPYTVLMRAHSFKGRGPSVVDELGFWNHADMIKTLIDYLALSYSEELARASA